MSKLDHPAAAGKGATNVGCFRGTYDISDTQYPQDGGLAQMRYLTQNTIIVSTKPRHPLENREPAQAGGGGGGHRDIFRKYLCHTRYEVCTRKCDITVGFGIVASSHCSPSPSPGSRPPLEEESLALRARSHSSLSAATSFVEKST